MTTINTNSSARTITIPNLVNGQIYRARVSAVNNYGQGPFANWIQVTPSRFSTDEYYYDNTLLMHFDDNRTGTYDPYGDYVSLLMHMDGANDSTTFVDSSLYNRNITVNGPAKLSSSQSRFEGTSAAFDADTSYLRVVSGPDFAFPSDFTIECWVYFTNSSRGYQGIIGAHNGSDQSGWVLYLEQNNNLTFQTSAGSSWGGSISSGETVTPNAWHHIAVSRSGSSLRIFVDGTLKATATNSVNVASASYIDIGDYTCLNQSGYNFTMSGYIDELRITKGIARYTSSPSDSFPSAPFPAILPLFVDSSAYNNPLIVSSTSISSSSSKFGGYAGYFNGSSLVRSNGTDIWQLGTEDFTVESWINPNNISGTRSIVGNYDGADGGWRLGVKPPSGGTPSYGTEVNFIATDGGLEVDVIIPGVLEITRNNYGQIYNSVVESSPSQYSSPANTSWNCEGWTNVCNYSSRSFYDYRTSLQNVGRNPQSSVNVEMLMKHNATNRIWLFKFSNWQANGGGAFAYTRKELLSCSVDSSIVEFRNGNSTVIEKTITPPIPTGAWSHIAAVRSSGVLKLFLDGTQVGSDSSFTTNITRNNSYGLSIGAYTLSNGSSSDYFNGYLDDLRITKGVARYPTNFSVPVSPAPDLGIASTVPSTPSNLTVSEDQGIVSLSWNRPSAPKIVDSRSPITYYGVEYSNNGGSSWTEDTGPFVVESTLNFNSLSDFTNNFVSSNPAFQTFSINNGSLQILGPVQDSSSSYSFIQNKNLLEFEINFLSTYDGNRYPHLIFSNDLGSVYIFYNNNWPADQGWDSLGRNRNNVIVGITPAGGSTTWYAHNSPRLDNNSIFNTIKTTINTTNKTMTLTINGTPEIYTNNMFGSGFKNFSHNPLAMNYNTSYVTRVEYIKYTTDDTSITNRRLFGLTSGNPYLFRVRAQNSVGFGNYSSTANISTLTNVPSGVSAIGDDSQAYVSWTAPTPNNSSIRDYGIQYSSDAGSSWNIYSRSSSIDTLINVTGLNNTFNYSFKVAAVNFAGTGIYSSDSSPITVAPRSDNLYNKTRILLHLDSN
jgi:hypothetical protein